MMILLVVLYITPMTTRLIINLIKKHRINNQMKGLANNSKEMTPQRFIRMRNKSFGGQGNPLYAKTLTFSGVYILYNKTKRKYYVGQAKDIIDRVNSHFKGSGNGDVYADYKYGDKWTIKMIDIKETEYTSLNKLEKELISYYNSYKKGYNKNRGNN